MFYLSNRFLKEALQNFLSKCAVYNKNPSWWYGLPLLHFLLKLCKPYEEMTEEAGYSDIVPHWWGIAQLKDSVEKFKQMTHKSWKM